MVFIRNSMKIVYTKEFIDSWDRLFHWKYAPLRWWKAFLYFPKDIKHFLQRARRGYADSDTWGLWHYLSDWMPQALRHMKKIAIGHPGELNSKTGFKEWKQILEKMAKGFEVSKKMDDLKYNSKRYKKYEKEFNEGMDLFKKWYHNLWD